MVRLWLLSALVLAAAPAQAQLLVSGTWTGTLADGHASTPASAAIERCATGFSVALTTAGRTVRTETATYNQRRLTFELPGYRSSRRAAPRTLRCSLAMASDGTLAGTCTAGRSAARLTLAPPADGGLGCS